MTADEWIAQGATFQSAGGHSIFYRRRGVGPTVVLLHGFPTWSYDYVELEADLAADHDVVTLDFHGYGASGKPRDHRFTVPESADVVEQLLDRLGIEHAVFVIHDYGAIVGQELLDRRRNGVLTFRLDAIHVLNCGIVYDAYRPTRMQRLLALPVVGSVVARSGNKATYRRLLDAIRGDKKLGDAEYDELWQGMARDNGHTLAHRHIGYNAERAEHHQRWESALEEYDGPLQLIWGLDDPVSGKHVLDIARTRLPKAVVVELDGVGHFPQSEAPVEVAAAIRAF